MKQLRLLHTADLHLGLRQYGLAVREDDFVRAAYQVADVAIAEHVDCVLVSGDVFDRKCPPAYAVQAFKDVVGRLYDAGIPVVTIDGNHDNADGRWATLCGAVPAYCDGTCVKVPGVDVVGIDYVSRQTMFDLLAETAHAVEDGKIPPARIVMLHTEIAEMAAYSTAVSIDELEPYMDRIGARYVALGHIHNRTRKVMPSGRVYCYPGSTEVNDTSELGVKTVELVTLHDDGRVETETRALATRRFDVVQVDSVEDLDTLIKKVDADTDAFWVVKVNLSAPGDLATRVPEVMRGRLFRAVTYGNARIERLSDRANAVAGLKEAIAEFFEPESEEAQLVAQMIDAPDRVREIAATYLDAAVGGNKKETT